MGVRRKRCNYKRLLPNRIIERFRTMTQSEIFIAKRNELLAETDFHGLSDRSMSSEMSTYRQALRDLPAQEGFPTNITWPTKPE